MNVKPNMTVLHIIGQLHSGGAERQLFLLCSGLACKGWDVHVLTFDKDGRWKGPLERAGVLVHELPGKKNLEFNRLLATRKLIKHLRPRILQTWMWSGNSYGRLAAIGLPVDVRIASERNTIDRPPMQRLLDRFLARFTDLYICNSMAGLRWLRRYLQSELNSCEAILNGVIPPVLMDLDRRQELIRELNLESGQQLLLAIGRLVSEKRQIDVIRAVAKLTKNGRNVRLLIIGVGDCQNELEAEIRALGLESVVQLIGLRQDIDQLLQMDAILCHVSSVEGQANVLLEAMATGKPIVTSDIPNNTELIENMKTGLVVPLHSPDSIARAIEQLMDDNELADRLGSACRKQILEQHSVEAMVDKYHDLYHKLLEAGLS